MPATNATVGKIAHILIEELGPARATRIIGRIAAETAMEASRNKSYGTTIQRLVQYFQTYWDSRHKERS